ncbi:hypothetical protein B0H10DRAFT_2186635 [Mycena sp. CBHHK59/15]|nr:hypothetical protein B0H10DRAFT_2186635 [Mycena sp. CBHHK59/15]
MYFELKNGTMRAILVKIPAGTSSRCDPSTVKQSKIVEISILTKHQSVGSGLTRRIVNTRSILVVKLVETEENSIFLDEFGLLSPAPMYYIFRIVLGFNHHLNKFVLEPRHRTFSSGRKSAIQINAPSCLTLLYDGTLSSGSNDSVIVSVSSCGRVKTVTVPRWAKGIDIPEAPAAAATLPAHAHDISETPAAAAMLPAHTEMIPPTDVLAPSAPFPPFVAPSATFDFPPLPSSTIPALDVGSFGLMQFDNQFDFGLDTYLGDPTYDFNFDPSLFGFDPTTTFASEIPWGSEFPSNFDWSAFTPPQELPTLPPLPASSPLAYAEYMEPSADGSAQTRHPRQEVDEKNIIHSKRQRTLSTRAADAAVIERPTKKSKCSRSCMLNWFGFRLG